MVDACRQEDSGLAVVLDGGTLNCVAIAIHSDIGLIRLVSLSEFLQLLMIYICQYPWRHGDMVYSRDRTITTELIRRHALGPMNAR